MSRDLQCPHCGKWNEAKDYFEHKEYEEIEAECSYCGKEFKWNWYSSIEFEVIEEEEQEDE